MSFTEDDLKQLDIALLEAGSEDLDSILETLNASTKFDVFQSPDWFHDGQKELWKLIDDRDLRRIIAAAGTQSGKTVAGPLIAAKLIALTYDPADSTSQGKGNFGLVCSPTYPLMLKKLWGVFKQYFKEQYGATTRESPSLEITISGEGLRRLTGKQGPPFVIHFGVSAHPDSLESATYKWAIGDEMGQSKVPRSSLEAITRRMSTTGGVLIILTTPYSSSGWFADEYRKAEARMPTYGFVRFESRMNPEFPDEEWEARKAELPDWKFDLFYRAILRTPPGLVYDCFALRPPDDTTTGRPPRDFQYNTCKPFAIPKEWRRAVGIDFGLINTAAAILVEEMSTEPADYGSKTGRWFLVSTYKADARSCTANEHMGELTKRVKFFKMPMAAGGSHQESGWREAWHAAGLWVEEPLYNAVEVQIQNIWTALHKKNLIVFEHLTEIIGEFQTFSRDVDEEGNVLDSFQNITRYHRLDALRYIGTFIFKIGMAVGRKIRFGLPKQST